MYIVHTGGFFEDPVSTGNIRGVVGRWGGGGDCWNSALLISTTQWYIFAVSYSNLCRIMNNLKIAFYSYRNMKATVVEQQPVEGRDHGSLCILLSLRG